jgi:phage shock protein PspC (stress-responsive transcriptional regulator)
MVYCQKCGKKNEDDAKYCSKCGTNLNSITNSFNAVQEKNISFEKQVDDFAEEIGKLGKKAGKTIETGVNNLGNEVKDIIKRFEKKVTSDSASINDFSSDIKSGEYKRLYRSGKNKYLGGVCGGVAEYLNIDPTLIRIFWVILVFFPPGLGIVMYILFWIFVHRNPNHSWL